MKHLKTLAWFLLSSSASFSATCPDPDNTLLKRGIIPKPWELSPFSENTPQADDGAVFSKANILIIRVGKGIACTYRNTVGYYSIFWEVNVKIPVSTESQWRGSLGGYECTDSIINCIFYPAKI